MKNKPFFSIKRLYPLLLSIFFISCSTSSNSNENNSGELFVTPTQIESDKTGVKTQVTIISDRAWNISCDANWVTISSKKGNKGTSMIDITTAKNESDARETSLIVALDDNSNKVTINIKQIKGGLDKPINKEGMESTAQQITKKMKVGWNLGNSLESWSDGASDQETSWGNPRTTKAMIDAIKAAGFNTVRIPVRWYPSSKMTESSIELSSQWLARVKEVVDYCIDNDMYAIINTHHEGWLESYPLYSHRENNNKKLTQLWRQVALYFENYDERLLFAGTNEVHIPDNWGNGTAENYVVQNGYNQCFIDAVRSTGGKNYYRNLIIQTYVTSPWQGLSSLTLPTDVVENKVSIEFHAYDPYEYALGGTVYFWGTPFKGYGTPDGQEEYFDNLFGSIRNKWGVKGYGLILGEYGVTLHFTEELKDVQAESRKYYMTYVTGKAIENGIVPIVWDNNYSNGNGSEVFGMFDRNNDMAITAPQSLEGLMEGAKRSYPF